MLRKKLEITVSLSGVEDLFDIERHFDSAQCDSSSNGFLRNIS